MKGLKERFGIIKTGLGGRNCQVLENVSQI